MYLTPNMSNPKEIPNGKLPRKNLPFLMKAGNYQLGTKSYPAQHEGMVVLICL